MPANDYESACKALEGWRRLVDKRAVWGWGEIEKILPYLAWALAEIEQYRAEAVLVHKDRRPMILAEPGDGVDYPCRVRIVDTEGTLLAPGIWAKTPEGSKPYIGKEGLAEMVDGSVRITLDDGTVLWGSDCWWERVKHEVD